MHRILQATCGRGTENVVPWGCERTPWEDIDHTDGFGVGRNYYHSSFS